VSRRLLPVLSLLALSAACSPDLPEPESAGARLYAERCNGCHRVFAPASLKFAMWEMQVERMQGEMVRRGVTPLTAEERQTILAYLRRHGDSGQVTDNQGKSK
jgi:mono/diheme cytochrome c family protein